MPNVYDRAEKTAADLQLETLTQMRERGENHLNGLNLLVQHYVDLKKQDANAVRDGETPVFTDEEWTLSDNWLTTLRGVLDSVRDLSVAAEGPQEADPLPEPEPEGNNDDTVGA